MIKVDAEKAVFGRIASFAAKKALEGEKVVIVNAEKAVISGNFDSIFKKFQHKVDMRYKGQPMKGSQYSKMPDRMLKKAIEGMMPHKKASGRIALKNVSVFIGIPEKFKKEKFEPLAEALKTGREKFVELGELSRQLGAKF